MNKVNEIIEYKLYLVNHKHNWYISLAGKTTFILNNISILFSECIVFELPKISKFQIKISPENSKYLYTLFRKNETVGCFHYVEDVLLYLDAKEPEIKHSIEDIIRTR